MLSYTEIMREKIVCLFQSSEPVGCSLGCPNTDSSKFRFTRADALYTR
jgi:hypothetical protein